MSTLAAGSFALAGFFLGMAYAVHPATRPLDRDGGRDQASGALTIGVFFIIVGMIGLWAK